MIPRTWTHPYVLTIGVEEGWADPETDPALIDWPARQAAALIPFEVAGGRPLSPFPATGIRYGRSELGRWGENPMADALVTASREGLRYLLMVERGDGYGWAVPGGSLEPGESGAQAAIRELAEETGLDLRSGAVAWESFLALAARHVPDPRASDEAWAVTVPVHVHLGELAIPPAVAGADDARRAEWLAADSYAALGMALAMRFDGQVFAAHEAMLRDFLDADGAR